jgi:hypothetical protein
LGDVRLGIIVEGVMLWKVVIPEVVPERVGEPPAPPARVVVERDGAVPKLDVTDSEGTMPVRELKLRLDMAFIPEIDVPPALNRPILPP